MINTLIQAKNMKKSTNNRINAWRTQNKKSIGDYK